MSVNVRIFTRLLVWASIALFGQLADAVAQPAPEYELKAAFIYNFSLFTAFGAPTPGPIALCVFGRDPFGPILTPLEGKPVGNATLTIQHPKNIADAIKRCHILYIGSSETGSLPSIVEQAHQAGLMTITDINGAARNGAMIELVVEDRKVGFLYNQVAAKSANVTISSKLLRLAKVIY